MWQRAASRHMHTVGAGMGASTATARPYTPNSAPTSTAKKLRTRSRPVVVARVCLPLPVELSITAGNGPAPPGNAIPRVSHLVPAGQHWDGEWRRAECAMRVDSGQHTEGSSRTSLRL